MIVTTAALCLALNIYHESRAEPIPGQYGVALVTLNRAGTKHRVCAEVFKSKQFSWTEGVVTRTEKGWVISNSHKPKEAHAWWVAQRIAATTLEGRMPDITNGSTHFHAKRIKPYWSYDRKPSKVLGRHVFYRLNYNISQ